MLCPMQWTRHIIYGANTHSPPPHHHQYATASELASTNQPTNKPPCKPTSQPDNQPTSKPANQQTSQPINLPTNKPISQPSSQSHCLMGLLIVICLLWGYLLNSEYFVPTQEAKSVLKQTRKTTEERHQNQPFNLVMLWPSPVALDFTMWVEIFRWLVLYLGDF